MTSPIATVLTLVATLLHGALGCCWHHSHDTATAAESQVVSHHTRCGHRGHGASKHGQTAESISHDSDGDHRHEHDGCDEDRCVYVTSKTGTVSASQLVTLAPAPSSSTADVASHGLRSRVDRDAAIFDPATSGQHRALLQVWLI